MSSQTEKSDTKSPSSASSSKTSGDKEANSNDSTCILVLGMAGAGKTTFIQKLNEHLWENDQPPYVINMDPACANLPYPANIDIRDTIDYKKVMKEYDLGPNGAIMTSLNLFATKFHQLADLVDQRKNDHDHIIFDTPGQIEVFNWSASGMIATESLASLMPTVIVYVLDTVRNINPETFMANMLYVCSIVFKAKLPIVVVFNKADLLDHKFLDEWMSDYDLFEKALESEQRYVTNLTRSLALVLDIFYENLRRVAVSSKTGSGMDEFLKLVQEARNEYFETYTRDRSNLGQMSEKLSRDMATVNLREDAIPEEEEGDDDDSVDAAAD